MFPLRLLAVALALVLAGGTPAAAFKKCRTADGKLLFVDIPPAGCVIEGEYENAPAPPAPAPSSEEAPATEEETVTPETSDVGNASAIASRRRIERELGDTADDLLRLDRELANAPKVPPGVYVDLEKGTGQLRDGTTVRPDVAADVARRREMAEERIRRLKEEYAILTRDLADRYGGVPSWWSESPRCERCP